MITASDLGGYPRETTQIYWWLFQKSNYLCANKLLKNFWVKLILTAYHFITLNFVVETRAAIVRILSYLQIYKKCGGYMTFKIIYNKILL